MSSPLGPTLADLFMGYVENFLYLFVPNMPSCTCVQLIFSPATVFQVQITDPCLSCPTYELMEQAPFFDGSPIKNVVDVPAEINTAWPGHDMCPPDGLCARPNGYQQV